MKNVMYVQIMGHEYPVEAAPGDELYVNRLARILYVHRVERLSRNVIARCRVER